MNANIAAYCGYLQIKAINQIKIKTTEAKTAGVSVSDSHNTTTKHRTKSMVDQLPFGKTQKPRRV